jgi:hypothetical protein
LFGGSTGPINSQTSQHTALSYSPTGDKWKPIANLPTARRDLGAAADPSGRLFVVGGNDGTQDLPTVEIYTPSTGEWQPGPPLGTPRSGLALVAGLDGNLYALGGSTAGVVGRAAEVYSPSTGHWSPLPDLPSARAYLGGAVLPDGRIVVVGGSDGATSLDRVDAYSPTSRTWTRLGGLTDARAYVGVVRGADDRVYAISGQRAMGDFTNNVETYDIATDSWSLQPNSTPTLGVARAATVGADGRIYVAGTDNFNFFGVCNAYGPRLVRMSSDHVPAGASVMLSGDNFAPNAKVSVYLGTVAAASAITDAKGALAAFAVALPRGPSGDQWLFAVDDASHYPVRAPITITP